jgi:small subunit ribosomal protein S16
MSVRVRLTRVGSKKNPIWRVVVADQRSPRDGRFIETIGHYNPQTEPSTIRIDEERFQHWVAHGAQPTGTVKQRMKAQAKGLTADPKTSAAVAAASPATAAPVSMEPATPPTQVEETAAQEAAPEAEAPPAEEADAAPAGDAEAAPAEVEAAAAEVEATPAEVEAAPAEAEPAPADAQPEAEAAEAAPAAESGNESTSE